MIDLLVGDEDANERLDKILARHLRVSVMEARRLIDRGKVRTSVGKVAKGTCLPGGTRVRVDAAPMMEGTRRVASSYAPEPDDDVLSVLHVDDQIVIVDKPGGVPTHPLAPAERGTVANRLVFVHPECVLASTDPRDGGFVHRLDAPTTGVLVAARSRGTYEALRTAFAMHEIGKTYWALVQGLVDDELTVAVPLATQGARARVDLEHGLEARTVVRPLVSGGDYTLVECETRTGRLHQIRAHLAHVDHPLVGDALYGGSVTQASEPQLHARSITLPQGTFTAPYPHKRRDLAEHLLGKML